MIARSRRGLRPGTVLPMMVASIVCLTGFVALAIDIGMLIIARNQAQNAADIAALTGVRALNGTSDNNYTNAEPSARIAAKANSMLGKNVVDSQITVAIGSYSYDAVNAKFTPNIPRLTGDTYSLVQATVTSAGDNPAVFSKVFGVNALNATSATSQAVHRPRDICLVVDLSGSMRWGSVLGVPFSGTRDNGLGNNSGSNNPETVYPQFGHYSATNAGLQGRTTAGSFVMGTYTYTPSNITEANVSDSMRPPVVEDFYQHNAYATPTIKAFSPPDVTLPPDSYATSPGGDKPVRVGNAATGNYAQHVQDIVGSGGTRTGTNAASTKLRVWELDGYASTGTAGSILDFDTIYGSDSSDPTAVPNAYPTSGSTVGRFYGYTQGPRYWGKTFMLWPPDPRWPLHRNNSDTGNDSESTYRPRIQQLLYECSTDSGNTASGYSTAEAGSGDTIGSANPGSNQIGMRVAGIYRSSGVSFTPSAGQPSPLNATNGQPRAWHDRFDATTGEPTAAGATELSNYLKNYVYRPGTMTNDNSARLISTDEEYQRIMRMYWRPKADWRRKFFNTNDNTVLWDSNEDWRGPTPDYSEILKWISASSIFPTQLRAGHIKYYDAIPTSITGSAPNYGNNNERFWREYIDYVLCTTTSTIATSGYGADYTWGTLQANGPPGGNLYMNYTDNPKRPRTRMWFGPMTMVDFLGNYNQFRHWWPGTCHESPNYACKIGLQAALTDMKNNHPNDITSLIFFSEPKTSQADTVAVDGTVARFNAVRGPLSKNYTYSINTLWFPQETLNAADGTNNGTEISPYSVAMDEVPKAGGATCYNMALMLAYNQLATEPANGTVLRNYCTPSTTVPEGICGGLGRKGAQKIIIFETDGAPNMTAAANPTAPQTSGSGSTAFKYYRVRFNENSMGTSEYPTATYQGDNAAAVKTELDTTIDALKAEYSTSRKPIRLYTIAFGPLMETGNANRAAALTTLRGMMDRAGTSVPAGTPAAELPGDQIITGTDTAMATDLQSIIGKIMQGSLSVALIK